MRRFRALPVDDPNTVDAVTVAAQANWAAFFAVTAVNEALAETRAEAGAMDDYLQFGPWGERYRKGVEALTGFYRTWYGETAADLIREYFDVYFDANRVLLMSRNDDEINAHPKVQRFREAQRQLALLHNNCIVDGQLLMRVGDELADGERAANVFYA